MLAAMSAAGWVSTGCLFVAMLVARLQLRQRWIEYTDQVAIAPQSLEDRVAVSVRRADRIDVLAGRSLVLTLAFFGMWFFAVRRPIDGAGARPSFERRGRRWAVCWSLTAVAGAMFMLMSWFLEPDNWEITLWVDLFDHIEFFKGAQEYAIAGSVLWVTSSVAAVAFIWRASTARVLRADDRDDSANAAVTEQ